MPPRIFTIAADRPFLATLAAGLVALAGGDPLALARMTVLLPTRRAARALREAFLRRAGAGGEPGGALLLPRLRPIGDLDADEFELELGEAEGADGDSLAIPPALPELRRRLLLTRLVQEWSEREGERALLPAQAAALAAALARLIDAAATQGASFAGLPDLAPEDLAEHWQTVLRFLEILPREWPARLAAEGALDHAERRNRLLVRQAARWRRAPPPHPVVAAGLSGGFPALDELLAVVAGLEQGAVILPGIDRSAAPEDWAAIERDPAHPQHLIALLLRSFELTADDVGDWPAAPAVAPSGRAARLGLLAQALRPAELTDAWRRLAPAPADALAGIARYDCAAPQDEAVTIALLLRRQLETPAATAALVTPDRELARRVAAELRRWDVDIDDSAGLPLNRTPPGAFLRLVLEMAESGVAPVPLLAALKHPLAAGGLAPEQFRDRARRLEAALRGPRPAPGFAGLRAVVNERRAGGGEAVLRGFVDRLETCLGTLPALLAAASVPVGEIAAAQIAAAERLAASDSESGVARLWREPAGEAAARFCHELIEAARDFPPLPGRHYPALFEALAAAIVVRPAYGRHPRLAIWGLVEARLQHADLLVLGGLNEGTWPGAGAYDPWMSRQMRHEFGVAPPERAIGIAAHDFAQAFGAAEVALTRATRREGVPTVPSRWLLRLDAVRQAVGLGGVLAPDAEIEAAAAAADQPDRHRPRPPGMPRPPLAVRPRRLSVTQIETWIRDPYAVYARHILGLRALDTLDAEPGRAELGIRVHDALAEFVRHHPRAMPEAAEAELLAIGERAFGAILSRPGVWAFWWPRFVRIARWFVAAERERRTAAIVESVSECRGGLTFAARGGPFTVTANADRIDRLAEGGLLIIDYKTGTLPPARDIDNEIAVQLPLEGAIARDGSFIGIDGMPRALEYWRLGGGEPAGKRCPVGGGDPAGLIERVLASVKRRVDHFDDPATPYQPAPDPRLRPRYSDYEQLERLKESEAEP